jgi:hypothetical protein
MRDTFRCVANKPPKGEAILDRSLEPPEHTLTLGELLALRGYPPKQAAPEAIAPEAVCD